MTEEDKYIERQSFYQTRKKREFHSPYYTSIVTYDLHL